MNRAILVIAFIALASTIYCAWEYENAPSALDSKRAAGEMGMRELMIKEGTKVGISPKTVDFLLALLVKTAEENRVPLDIDGTQLGTPMVKGIRSFLETNAGYLTHNKRSRDGVAYWFVYCFLQAEERKREQHEGLSGEESYHRLASKLGEELSDRFLACQPKTLNSKTIDQARGIIDQIPLLLSRRISRLQKNPLCPWYRTGIKPDNTSAIVEDLVRDAIKALPEYGGAMGANPLVTPEDAFLDSLEKSVDDTVVVLLFRLSVDAEIERLKNTPYWGQMKYTATNSAGPIPVVVTFLPAQGYD